MLRAMAKSPPDQPEKIKVPAPASLITGPVIAALGLLIVSGGGFDLGGFLILVGIVLVIVGWTARQRLIRDETNFRIQMLLHEAHDPVDD